MEFRGNFIFWLFIQLIYIGLHLLTINIYFNFTDTIAGWTKSEVYLLVGVFRLIEGTFKMFIHPNIVKLPDLVNKGELDFAISKPVSSLFILGTRYQNLDEITTILGGVGILVYVFMYKLVPFTSGSILGIAIFSLLGIATLYSLMMIFSTFSVFFNRLSSVWVYWEVLSKSLRFPTDVYTHGSKLFNGIFWPFVIVVTLPVQILLGKVPPIYLILEVLGCFALLTLTNLFWNFALRHYSSASS